MATLLDLSDELLFHTFSFLEPHDLGRLAKTCSRFRPIAHDHLLWKSVIQRIFPHIPHDEQNLQSYFEQLEFRKNLSNNKFSVKQYTLPCDLHQIWVYNHLFQKIIPMNDNLVAFSNNQSLRAFSLDTQEIKFMVNQPFCIYNQHLYYVQNNVVYEFQFDTGKLKPLFFQESHNPIRRLDVHNPNLALAYEDGSISIWSFSSLSFLARITPVGSPISTLKFNQQGTLLVIRYENKQCKVWSRERLFQLKDLNYFEVAHFDENHLFIQSGHLPYFYKHTLNSKGDLHRYGIFSRQIVGFYKNHPIEADSFDVDRLKAGDVVDISIPRESYYDIKVHVVDDYMLLSNGKELSVYDLAKNTLIGSFANPSDSPAAPVLFKRRIYTLNGNVLSVHKSEDKELVAKILERLNH